MSDFLLAIENGLRQPNLKSPLESIPSHNSEDFVAYDFSWGQFGICPPTESYLSPCSGKSGLTAVVGRPLLSGADAGAPVTSAALDAFGEGGGRRRFLDSLSGTFALVVAFEKRLFVITDPLGSLPVFASELPNGGLVIGSHPESVAKIGGIRRKFDQVSLTRFILESRITYPHTTREGMIELAPGAVYELGCDARSLRDLEPSRYWIPEEPTGPPELSELQDELYHACLQAAGELPQNRDSVSITLSGGSDSRAIVGAFQQASDVDLRAVTVADHENREWKVARRVAERADIPHRTLWRPPHYYASVLGRTTQLNGFEHCAQDAHLAGLAQDIGDDRVLISGSGADTLLKGEYFEKIPTRMWLKRRRSSTGHIGSLTRDELRAELSQKNTLGISQGLVEAVVERKWRRYQELTEIRPRSASEWLEIYPNSRRKAISFTLSNMRLTDADEFFLHRAIVDVAARAGLWQKVSRELTRPVYMELAPDRLSIKDANNQLPASAPWPVRDTKTIAQYVLKNSFRKVAKRLGNIVELPPMPAFSRDGDYPWYTQGSWIEHQVFMSHSDRWKQLIRNINREHDDEVIAGFFENDSEFLALSGTPEHRARRRFALAQAALLTASSSH